jgi:hypothetical protein
MVYGALEVREKENKKIILTDVAKSIEYFESLLLIRSSLTALIVK